MICADTDHPDPADRYGLAGPGLIAQPASDNGANGRLHSRTGMLRAVENGYAVAWAGQLGHAVIADRFGRVLAEAVVGGAEPFTTIVADVPVAPAATLTSRLGGWFGWLSVVVAALAVGATVRVRRPSRT